MISVIWRESMKKLVYFGILVVLTVPELAGCSVKKSLNSFKASSEQRYDKSKKLNTIVSELKVKLRSKTNIEWSSKIATDVTNADINKGIMVDVFPKNNSDSRLLEKWGELPTKDTQKMYVIGTIVSKAAKKLPDDNTELNVGFESMQKSKGVVPVARSVKEMDAIVVR